MSTFLELARTLREDCGIPGAENTPTAVTGQKGEMLRVVNWIKRAYREVQNLHPNWNFLRFDFSFPTIVAQGTYTRASISLTELTRWKLDTFRAYLTASGQIDEQWLIYVPWPIFRDQYLMSANRTVQGRPQWFSIKPDKSVAVFPLPNDAYTIVGEYWKRPQLVTANADLFTIPEEFEDVIVGLGMSYYGAYEAAPEVYAEGVSRHNAALSGLQRDYLPEIAMEGALA